MSDIQHIGGRTPDLTEENVDKLVALFPDVLTEVTDQQTGKAESGDYDDDGGQLVVNPESNGRFHSDWCSMIYPRLLLARDLLASDGVIFISIDENESANLKKIGLSLFGVGEWVGGWWCWSGSLGVWIPRRCSPPPCNCLTRGGCRAWSSVTRRTADGNCISRSGSRRVRGSPARNRGAARPRVRCMTRGSACGGI